MNGLLVCLASLMGWPCAQSAVRMVFSQPLHATHEGYGQRLAVNDENLSSC